MESCDSGKDRVPQNWKSTSRGQNPTGQPRRIPRIIRAPCGYSVQLQQSVQRWTALANKRPFWPSLLLLCPNPSIPHNMQHAMLSVLTPSIDDDV